MTGLVNFPLRGRWLQIKIEVGISQLVRSSIDQSSTNKFWPPGGPDIFSQQTADSLHCCPSVFLFIVFWRTRFSKNVLRKESKNKINSGFSEGRTVSRGRVPLHWTLVVRIKNCKAPTSLRILARRYTAGLAANTAIYQRKKLKMQSKDLDAAPVRLTETISRRKTSLLLCSEDWIGYAWCLWIVSNISLSWTQRSPRRSRILTRNYLCREWYQTGRIFRNQGPLVPNSRNVQKCIALSINIIWFLQTMTWLR